MPTPDKDALFGAGQALEREGVITGCGAILNPAQAEMNHVMIVYVNPAKTSGSGIVRLQTGIAICIAGKLATSPAFFPVMRQPGNDPAQLGEAAQAADQRIARMGIACGIIEEFMAVIRAERNFPVILTDPARAPLPQAARP